MAVPGLVPGISLGFWPRRTPERLQLRQERGVELALQSMQLKLLCNLRNLFLFFALHKMLAIGVIKR
jgi:hypothetical protein